MLLSANSTVKDEFLLEDYFGSLSNKFGRFVLQWRVDLFVGDESGNYYTRKYYGSLDFFLPEGVKHIGSRGLSEKTYVWKYSEIVFSKGED